MMNVYYYTTCIETFVFSITPIYYFYYLLQNVFNEFDKDENRVLDKKELRKAFRSLGKYSFYVFS